MSSPLEDTLLRCRATGDRLHETLFGCLDDGASLQRLRIVSRILHDLVDRQPGHLFRQLHVRAPFPGSKDITSLEIVAPLCRSLTISVGYPPPKSQLSRDSTSDTRQRHSTSGLLRRGGQLLSPLGRRRLLPGARCHNKTLYIDGSISPFSPHGTHANIRTSIPPSRQNEERQLWKRILSCFHQLRLLTLRINGNPAWPGCTAIDDILVTIRVAIESADLKRLREFCLVPVHAMGIIHLRWYGMGAYSQAFATAASVWMQIETLELRVHNPFTTGTLTEAQTLMFKKILHEYLRSFAPSLRCLRLVWLGGEGPSPLALHYEAGLEGRQGIRWPRLEELWVGNIRLPNQTITLARELARPEIRVKILRSTRRDSWMETGDSSAWMEVLGPSLLSDRTAIANDGASSVYSQDGRIEADTWLGGISRSSRDVTVMLDF